MKAASSDASVPPTAIAMLTATPRWRARIDATMPHTSPAPTPMNKNVTSADAKTLFAESNSTLFPLAADTTPCGRAAIHNHKKPASTPMVITANVPSSAVQTSASSIGDRLCAPVSAGGCDAQGVRRGAVRHRPRLRVRERRFRLVGRPVGGLVGRVSSRLVRRVVTHVLTVTGSRQPDLTARRNAQVEAPRASTHTPTQIPRSAPIVVQLGVCLNDSANASTAYVDGTDGPNRLNHAGQPMGRHDAEEHHQRHAELSGDGGDLRPRSDQAEQRAETSKGDAGRHHNRSDHPHM